jgi:hypothetical protein
MSEADAGAVTPRGRFSFSLKGRYKEKEKFE